SLVERRAHQLLGGEVKSDTIVSDTINALWRDWKNKSDGALGTALRQSCERIFGANNRPSERVGQAQVDRALLLLPIGTLATSEDVFQRGVFPEVARAAFDAIVRAQWEVTQYLLDEANMRDQYIPL